MSKSNAPANTVSSAPASAIKVLEVGSYAAAYCGRLWTRAGADVVQVALDKKAPGWVSNTASELFTDSGKRRVPGCSPDELATLANRADIVIAEAGKADELLALGFADWNTAIKLSITPFGLTGPKRNWRATPNVLLAMGGYTQVIGAPDRAPLSLPGHYLEFQTGALAYGVSQALHFSNKEDVIDLGMLEVLASLHHYTTVRYHADGQIRERRGSDLWFVVPSDLFACADGWVYLTITPSFWETFALLLDRPELIVDPKFADNDARMTNRYEVQKIIAACFAELTCAELEKKAHEFRVPLGIAQTPAEVMADTHLEDRNFWELAGNTPAGDIKSPGLPWRGLERTIPEGAAPTQVSASKLW